MSMNLEDLLENSGIEKTQPPHPKGGIPRRYLPPPIRWAIKAVVLPFIWLDSFSQWVAKLVVPPPFVRAGKCKKRGNCCHYILVRKFKGPLSFLDLFWHTQVNGFFRREKKAVPYNKGMVYVMGCRYLKKNGSCGNYFFRPAVCRTWPRIEIFGIPETLKGCGIYAKKRTSHPLNILKD
jgi:hypothetical protein